MSEFRDAIAAIIATAPWRGSLSESQADAILAMPEMEWLRRHVWVTATEIEISTMPPAVRAWVEGSGR